MKIGSPEAMRAEPRLSPPDEWWREGQDAAEAADTVLEYVDDHASDVIRTIDRHFEAGRDREGEALMMRLVAEVKRHDCFVDEYTDDAVRQFIVDAMEVLLG